MRYLCCPTLLRGISRRGKKLESVPKSLLTLGLRRRRRRRRRSAELGLDVAMTAPEVISQARQDLKLEDIELSIAEDARRLVAALRTGTGAYLPAGGAAAGSSSGYTMQRVSARPLR